MGAPSKFTSRVTCKKFGSFGDFGDFGNTTGGIGETGSRIHGMDESRVRFPYPPPSGGVAQLVRASACHAEGRGFESLHSRHLGPLRLSVRTSGFHPEKTGSIPVVDTNLFISFDFLSKQILFLNLTNFCQLNLD